MSDELAEAQAKAERNFGGSAYQEAAPQPPQAAQHFGPVLISCDQADLRLTPLGVEVHGAQGRQFIAAELPAVPRGEVVDEMWSVGRLGQAARHDGLWSRATLEVCLAMLAGQASPETLRHQVPTRD